MDQTLLSCLSPNEWRWLLSVRQILAEVAAKTAIRCIARGLFPRCTAFYRALCLSGVPWDLPYPRAVRASQVEPGWRSGMSCVSCPLSGARRLEKAWRQLTEGRRKASDSRGLSLHPAGENVEAEAKLSEAAERKRCPEGRDGRDRPVE